MLNTCMSLNQPSLLTAIHCIIIIIIIIIIIHFIYEAPFRTLKDTLQSTIRIKQ